MTDAQAWIISDGAAGNERQALALARALGVDARVLGIDVAAPWRWLAPHLLAGARSAMRDRGGQLIAPPWPRLSIGCGRQAALLVRALADWSSGDCFRVQILDPRIDPGAFDLVVAPRHDHLVGSNVITTLGSLNPVDAAWLATARLRFATLADLPTPRTTVLFGATNAAQHLDAGYVDALLARLGAAHAREGGSFLVSTSRRTPGAVAQHLRRAFSRWPGVFWSGDADGPNPYSGLLAWAERIVVTPDSVNMLSEACASDATACTFAPRPIGGKFAALHAALVGGGHLCDLDAALDGAKTVPLRETADVAAAVAGALAAARLRTR